MTSTPPPFNLQGQCQHLLTLDGLSADTLTHILDTAASFIKNGHTVPKSQQTLHGKMVFNLFFENSTRTRTTFEIAAKRLCADVINLDIATSSTSKGELLLDMIDNLCAMQADMFIVRHPHAGAPAFIAQHLMNTQKTHIHIINAGDGYHAHPTQGLLDLYTIRHYKKAFEHLSVAIVGDILHSRVARSDLHGLVAMHVPDIRVIGPDTLLPESIEDIGKGIRVFTDMAAGLKEVDVIILLRLQHERMTGALLPSSRAFFQHYGLTPCRLALAKHDAIIMHPGPINRGAEIDSAIVDSPQTVILPQVSFGIAIRMAVMHLLR